jgi:hypothetical protein
MAFATQVPKERPKGCELPGRRELAQTGSMQASQKGANEQVVDVIRFGNSPKLLLEMNRELVQIMSIGSDGMH